MQFKSGSRFPVTFIYFMLALSLLLVGCGDLPKIEEDPPGGSDSFYYGTRYCDCCIQGSSCNSPYTCTYFPDNHYRCVPNEDTVCSSYCGDWMNYVVFEQI